MKLPFTREEFLEVFRNYNLTVWPAQLILNVLALGAFYLVYKKKAKFSVLISGFLAFLWLWMGVVYHFIFFSAINKAANLFAILFIAESVLLFYSGIFRKSLSFAFNQNLYGITGLVMVIFALVLYPLLGYFLNHRYPYSPTFGLPCPTTIFSIGFFLMNEKRPPLFLLIIPILWSLIGFSAAFYLGIKEDIALLLAGLFALFLLGSWKKYQLQKS